MSKQQDSELLPQQTSLLSSERRADLSKPQDSSTPLKQSGSLDQPLYYRLYRSVSEQWQKFIALSDDEKT